MQANLREVDGRAVGEDAKEDRGVCEGGSEQTGGTVSAPDAKTGQEYRQTSLILLIHLYL